MVDTKKETTGNGTDTEQPQEPVLKEQYIVLYKTNKKGAWVMLPMLYTSLGSAINKLKVQVRAVEAKALKLNIADSKAAYEKIKL